MNITGMIIIVALIVFIALFFGTLILHGRDDEFIWINTRTGEEVYVEGECNIINPKTNERFDGIIYHTVVGHNIYVTKYCDFIVYFEKKINYNEENKK